MAVQRIDIERALAEIISQEEGMRFQGLAVVLGKMRWPELVANPRKKDGGLDAYAGANWTPTPGEVGKGLAASITTEIETKVPGDAKTAKRNYRDLGQLIFVTPHTVGRALRNRLVKQLRDEQDIDLLLVEREEIITTLMMPQNASLCASFLHLDVVAEPDVADLIDRTRRAAAAVNEKWARKTKGHPLIELSAVRLDTSNNETMGVLSHEQIDQAISQSGRIILEGPAGCGKTTTLVQVAQRPRTAGIPFIIELASWTMAELSILEHIAGTPEFLAGGLSTADLARVQLAEPFLFLLNGWNEVAESHSARAHNALRELERDFPRAGIMVATRTHHLTPPLPGASRLRLLSLRPNQRESYLALRLGEKSGELRSRVDSDPSLEALTRTPLILSEVASLFEAGVEIPSTKSGVLARVVRLHEQREEHRNALEDAPVFGRQADYLKALAAAMTGRGAVALSESDARAVIARVAKKLKDSGQIDQAGAPSILASLTAHHVLERVEYPDTTFQFEHQQVQEYYATIHVRADLFDLTVDDHEAIDRFTANYVNLPSWAEPLCMIAETLAQPTGGGNSEDRNIRAGVALVNMALAVDLVFAGELAQLCGAAVWNVARTALGGRLRAAHADPDPNHQQYAIAAMLATGAEDFRDIILPLLSGSNQQTRLGTYRLWSEFHLSSLGSNWYEEVRTWSEAARAEFVSELLHQRVGEEIVSFAVEDDSVAVKKAAASGLMWTGSDSALTRVLDSMDARTFEEVARRAAEQMPPALKQEAIAALRGFVARTTDPAAGLSGVIDLLKCGEAVPESVVKDAMSALSDEALHNLHPHSVRLALEHLRDIDPAWLSRWIATRIADASLRWGEDWLPFVSAVPADLVETCLQRLESEDLSRSYFEGIIDVIAVQGTAELAARAFSKLRELQRSVDAEPNGRHEFAWHVIRQLQVLLHRLPGDLVAEGILGCVKAGDALDAKVTTRLLSWVAGTEREPFQVADTNLRSRLRAYLKGNLGLVLGLDDFNGEEKAGLASSMALVGMAEDMADLKTIIHADIERVRRGRAARAAGDRGPLADGGVMTCARRNITAALDLDPVGADQVLIDLLAEPEYLSEAANAMARDFVPKPRRSWVQRIQHDLIWSAREHGNGPLGDDRRRIRFTAALNAEITRLQARKLEGSPAPGLQYLASALAAIDGRGSSATVQQVIAMHDPWEEYTCLDAIKRLLLTGAEVSASTAFTLVDSIVERMDKWANESLRDLLGSALALCPFVDDPAAGIAKMREVLGTFRPRVDALQEIITALGESRSDDAVDLLCDLAAGMKTLGRSEDAFINAIASFDTKKVHDVLMGSVDPDRQVIAPTRPRHRDDSRVNHLTNLARRWPEEAAQMMKLCERDLPEVNRQILSKVLGRLGTPEALSANLNLIDDTRSSPIPQGLWDQLDGAFVERIPHDQDSNAFTLHARASNDLRARLLQMAGEDERRRKAAHALLGQIEVWRLEYGRPTDEPRHPHLASGLSWPPSWH